MKGNRLYVNWKGRWKRKIGSCMQLNWTMKRFVECLLVFYVFFIPLGKVL